MTWIRIDRLNPIVVMTYFVLTITVSIFCMNPIVSIISLLGFGTFYLSYVKGNKLKFLLWSLGLFLVTVIINPMVNHNGVTVLFFIGNNGITLEAFLYGVFSGVMILAALFLSASFSKIMTSDKILYCLGKVSPRFALMISMILKFIPGFTGQAKKIKMAARAQGIYKDDNLVDGTISGARSFMVLSGWALENGIITADSMEARGYGCKKRTNYSNYKFKLVDLIELIIIILLVSPLFVAKAVGEIDFIFYPEIVMGKVGYIGVVAISLYVVLVCLPIVLMILENARWKYLKSKI